MAFRGGSVESSSIGVPVTFTASLKFTFTATILPVPYVPSLSGESTDKTTGAAAVMILTRPESASEPGAPGAGSVRLALVPSSSLIVPPLRDSALVPV